MKTNFIGTVKLGYYSPSAGFRHLEVCTKSADIDSILYALKNAADASGVELRVESTGKYSAYGATVIYATVIVDNGLTMNNVNNFSKELKNNGLRLAN